MAEKPPGGGSGFLSLTEDAERFAYQQSDVQSHTYLNTGLVHLPVAEPARRTSGRVAADLIPLHAPIGRRVVTFHVVRTGERPFVPTSRSEDPNETLLSAEVFAGSPGVAGDSATPVFEYKGRYVYALKYPVIPHLDGVPGASSAATPASKGFRSLPRNRFVDGLK